MGVRPGGPALSILLTVGLAIAAGCGSEAEPQHNAGSIHDAAKQLGPKATELKQFEGVPMKGMPDGLKPMGGDEGKTRPDRAVAGLKPLSGGEAPAGLPAGLKAFPTEPSAESAPTEPAPTEPAQPSPAQAAPAGTESEADQPEAAPVDAAAEEAPAQQAAQ